MQEMYEKDTIADFEMEILAKGEHDVFLKQSFSLVKDTINVFIDCTGFRKISEADLDTPLKLLDILEKVCLNLRRAENYMFDLRKIKISKDVFYLNEYGKLAFKYELVEDAEVNLKIKKMIEGLAVSNRACKDYVNIFVKNLEKNYSIDKLATIAAELKREAYYCGYN